MGLEKIEAFLERNIEGFFNRRFASDLEVAELTRELINRAGQGIKKGSIPNLFEFSLAREDYQRLCSRRVQDELLLTLKKEIIKRGLFLDGELSVQMRSQESLKRGSFSLKARTVDTLPPKEEGDTLVLTRSELSKARPLNLPKEQKLASLQAVKGPDKGARLELGEKKIYIGRRDKNEFILTDTRASRLHAWIAYERHRHVIYDAGSTNGTFVGGVRLTSRVLSMGDEIRIGSTLLRYEVIS